VNAGKLRYHSKKRSRRLSGLGGGGGDRAAISLCRLWMYAEVGGCLIGLVALDGG